VFEKLQWWLSARFSGRFEDMNCTMEHGKQADWHSCGICSPNMIACCVQRDPLWSVAHAPSEHAKWFDRVVTGHNSSVSNFISISIQGIYVNICRQNSCTRSMYPAMIMEDQVQQQVICYWHFSCMKKISQFTVHVHHHLSKYLYLLCASNPRHIQVHRH
jgi:hypothetical protein